MPITSLFFELRAPSVSIFESRHFPAVFLLTACFLRALLIFLGSIGISVTLFRVEQIGFVSLTVQNPRFLEKVRFSHRNFSLDNKLLNRSSTAAISLPV